MTTSNSNFIQRIAKVKKIANEKNIEALWITKPENKYYISGFESSNFFLFITKTKNYLLTDFRYFETAQGLKDIYEPVLLTNQYTALDFLQEHCPAMLGIEYKSITFDFYNDMMEKIKPRQVVSADQIIEGIRAVKEESEIDYIKKAAQIADKGFTHMLEFIKPGLTEKNIAFELEFFMKKLGADSLSFDSIIASGERGSLPHATPSNREICQGDLVTLDFGVKVNGYCSDMTRTIGIGSLNKEQKDVYKIVFDAQKNAADIISDGVAAAQADKAARQLIEDAGYGAYFGHGLGHGVGLEIHEAPTLNTVSKEMLAADMIVTIEPGIYLPEKFGIRIEDLAVVTNTGIITLSMSDKELIII